MAHLHEVKDQNTHFTIDPETMEITNASEVKALKQGDHGAERYTFQMPRYIEGHDMSVCNKVEVHYNNVKYDSETRETKTNSSFDTVEDFRVSADSDDTVAWSWLIKGDATELDGTLNFCFRFACMNGDVVEYQKFSEIFVGVQVGATIFNTEAVAKEYADVLEAWRQDILAKIPDGLPDGGTKGQILFKTEDGAEWRERKAAFPDMVAVSARLSNTLLVRNSNGYPAWETNYHLDTVVNGGLPGQILSHGEVGPVWIDQEQPEIPETPDPQIPSDWAQNNAKAVDYIKNRPGGYIADKYTDDVVLADGYIMPYDYSRVDIVDPEVYLYVYETYISYNNQDVSNLGLYLDVNGEKYSLQSVEYDVMFFGEHNEYSVVCTYSGGAYITYIENRMEHPFSKGEVITARLQTKEANVVHKFDPQYLYTTDWNQEDETAPDYIKNRTHYLMTNWVTDKTPINNETPSGTAIKKAGANPYYVAYYDKPDVQSVLALDVNGTVNKFVSQGTNILNFDNGYTVTFEGTSALLRTATYGGLTAGTTYTISFVKAVEAVHPLERKYLPPDAVLPSVTTNEAGKFLGVNSEGAWEPTAFPETIKLPAFTESDNGKVLGVVDGQLAWVDKTT